MIRWSELKNDKNLKLLAANLQVDPKSRLHCTQEPIFPIFVLYFIIT
jgi:hypothetical protein